MRRRSERGKTKPDKGESPEKPAEKQSRSSRHGRRRRKSTSSSDSESKSASKKIESTNSITQPLLIEVPKAETSQDGVIAGVPANKEETTNNSEISTIDSKPNQEPSSEGNSKEKEESLWKVQSANGAGDGGEIQKLKICRQRPTESPEIGDTALRKRLGRGAKDNRSTDDSTQEESEKESRKSKHRSRTSSRNSPLISPTVVCDVSGDSPTKIKIINVGLINPDSKTVNVTKPTEGKNTTNEEQTKKSDVVDIMIDENDLANISLPVDEELPPLPVDTKETSSKKSPGEVVSEETIPERRSSKEESKKEDIVEQSDEVGSKDKSNKSSPKKLPSPPASSPKREVKEADSSGDSETSEDESKPRRVKKKRRRDLQSSVQRRLSGSNSPKKESSDSEEDVQKKKEADRRESTDKREPKQIKTGKDEKTEDTPQPKVTEPNVEESSKAKEQQQPVPRKRRWGSSKSNRPEKKPVSISTEILKSLVPDAKPIPADELQLSVEEEEGQLVDDDEDDDVVALMAKEEEAQLELERLREDRQREKEQEDRRKRLERQERFEKSKKEQLSANFPEKDNAARKILLLTDDVKKVSRPPTPPRRKPTSVLYITHLVRPFTVQQLKNLLLRTGTIAENGFWIDKIKSKCYVEYTTEDAAVETRHALHGVKWPTSNPKTLVVEFATHDDLAVAQALSEEADVPRKSEPLNMVEGWVADQARIKEKNRRTIVREWDVGKPEHPDEALEYEQKMKEKEKKEQERKSRKERHHRTPSPEAEHHARKSRKKDEDAPAKLLDDLFRKTKSSPCIYWLPLTQEQIAVKEEMRRQHMAEHERRLAELKKADQARRDRERRSRK